MAIEWAAYSMLQSGPEFAAWRVSRPATPQAEAGSAVTIERNGGTLVITLDRPQRHNAISTRPPLNELTAAVGDRRG